MAGKTMKAPKHLQAPTRRWWASVVADFELEPHHVRLLTLAGESWDRCQQAREALAANGLTFTDRHGSPRARPEVGIERDSRIAFARLLRELGLDVQPPWENRAPAITANAFRRVGGN
jgi:P27 family predicted phage terminase small subunit